MSKVKPLYDRVLVKRAETLEKTAGGIILPDSAKQEKPKEGVVVAVGQGTLKDDGTYASLLLKEGDKVLFAEWGGTEIKVNGEDLLIIKESDIQAIVE
jgi:chaperonin GroES